MRYAVILPMSSENIIDLYDRHAASFDRDRDRSLFERSWLDRFLTHIPNGGTVLDIGCGMGEPVARYFIERGYHVTGVDSSLAMVAMCRKRFPDQDWVVADMRALALERRFDGVIAWDSFFHLAIPAQRAMFPIFAEHASPGAPLMFNAGHSEGEAIGLFQGDPLFHASLEPAEYRRLLAANGFDMLEYKGEDPDCGGRCIWLARRI